MSWRPPQGPTGPSALAYGRAGVPSVQPAIVLPVAELFIVAVALVFSSNLLEVFLRSGEGGGIVRLLYLMIYAAAGYLALRAGALGLLVIRAWAILVLILLPCLSFAWSVLPAETIERMIGVVGTTIVGLFLGWHFRCREIVILLAWALLLNMVLSIAVIVAVPQIGIAQSGPWQGTWVGIHFHKNGLGAAAQLSFLVMVYATVISGGLNRKLFAGGMALSLLLLVGSKSTTALLIAMAGFSTFLMVFAFQHATKLAIMLVCAGLVVTPMIGLMIWQFDLIALVLNFFGKDFNLSSRVPLWSLLWPFVEDRFWLGYGYGAFWQLDLPWIDLIEARLNFVPFYSHNGVMELLLNGGVILLAAFAWVYLTTFARAIVFSLSKASRPEMGFPLVFLIIFLLGNVTEATILSRNDLFWTLFVAFSALLLKEVSLKLGDRQGAPVAIAR
ncbi:MAG: O-antigen ligase family protein [Geminicoccaceae bacterium]